MFKHFLSFILLFIILSIELSGLSGRIFLSPYLCLVIFFALSPQKLAIVWPVLGGLVLDFFSIFNFPFFTLSFLSVFLITQFISQKIVIPKDLISFIAFSVIGVIFYNLIFFFLNSITYFLRIEQITISFNRSYFLHFSFNVIFTFFLLIIFKRNREIFRKF